LADLGNAEALSAVESEPVLYPGGYGYQIKPGTKAKWLQKRGSSFLNRHESDIKWVAQEFGSLTSSQLELVSTIIYVDREAKQNNEKIKLRDLAKRVHEVKPHFSDAQILSSAEQLLSGKLLKAAK
jgi:hypothetical protein